MTDQDNSNIPSLPGDIFIRAQTALLDHAYDAIFIWDWNGPITFWNSGAEQLYGYSRSEAVGQVSRHFLQTGPDDVRTTMLTGLERDGAWEGVMNRTRRDGAAVIVETRQILIRDDGRAYVLEVDRDVTARKQAEERLAFLSQASVALATSLDPAVTLTNVAQLAVPRLADWCAVHLVETDGAIAQLAVTHVDPDKVTWARELQERFPYDRNASTGLPQVLRTGASELYAEITDAVLAASAKSPEQLALLRDIGMTSAMIVPLLAHGCVLGAITFVAAKLGRHYDAADLAFAEELAHRCALAVDNARLFGMARDAEATVRRLNAELEQRVVDRTAQLTAANRELERWAHIFERAKMGIVVSSPESERLELLNPAYAEMHGYTVGELTGRPVRDVFAPEVRDVARAEFAIAHEQGHHVFESIHLRRDGTQFPVQIDVTVVKDDRGAVLFRVANVQDITVRRAQEVAVLAANRELEAFSYSVSHDLRAPLRAVDGFSRILIEDYEPLLPAEAKRYLTIVRDGTVQMGQLIDDLLAFSRLGRQPLQRRHVLTADLVGTVLQEVEAELASRPVEVTVDDLPACCADPALLKQVYANLISNALKYTRGREPAIIHIGATNDPDGSGTSAFFVRDNGVGFDMAYAEKLFGVFQRLHRAEDYEGTGVGLALVQRIIHRHGGRIWVDAALDRGATFWFTLSSTAASGAPAPPAGETSAARIQGEIE